LAHERLAIHWNVVTADPDTPVDELASLLDRHRIKGAPIVRDGRMLGIVSRVDLLRTLVGSHTATGYARTPTFQRCATGWSANSQPNCRSALPTST
jgi:CBS domain-containing protein